MICVQEPWINRDAETDAEVQRTQTHPRYDIFAPLGAWTTRPRTMIYVRKDLEASQKLLKDEEHPDVCMVTLRTNHGPLDVINIYNAGPGSERTNEAVQRLMEYQALGEGLICGDFNLHHGHWDPNTARDDAMADSLLDWLLDQSVALLTDPEVATRGEAVLDLTMATNDLYKRARVEACVDERYACGSDHEPILTCIFSTQASQGGKRMGRYSMERLDPEVFGRICAREAANLTWNVNAEVSERPRTVNHLAEKIQDILLLALQESITRSSGRGTGQRWWTKECDNAVAEHHRARREWKLLKYIEALEPELRLVRNDSKRNLAKAIKKARDDFFRKIISELKEPKQVHQAAKWMRKQQRVNAPPQRDPDGNTLMDTQEKIQLLMRTHVRLENSEDLEAPQLPETEDTWNLLTTEEVRKAVNKAGDTTPGPDTIPNAALKLTWPHLGGAITAMYNLSLEWSIFPSVFKRATLCTVLKSGKRPKWNPKSYRLIALLPKLGKGLERVIARRLAFEAVERGTIPHNYVCATPKRSATDLILSLVDEIEDSLLNKKDFATFDVKRAFDAVHLTRMVKRLIDQNWPTKVCRWVRTADNPNIQLPDGKPQRSRIPSGGSESS